METLEESPFTLGKSKWELQSALPDMWKVVHQCKNVGLEIQATETIVCWYTFFEQHDVASLEEFLQKFAESAQKKDFYDFSKYCIGLYRKVHEKQLTNNVHPIEQKLIRTFMEEAEEMDQLGDEYHEDPADDYWQRRASIAGPDYRELPRAYVKLRGSYKSFENFMADHKRFDGFDENTSIKDQMRRSVLNKHRNGTSKKIHTVLGG